MKKSAIWLTCQSPDFSSVKMGKLSWVVKIREPHSRALLFTHSLLSSFLLVPVWYPLVTDENSGQDWPYPPSFILLLSRPGWNSGREQVPAVSRAGVRPRVVHPPFPPSNLTPNPLAPTHSTMAKGHSLGLFLSSFWGLVLFLVQLVSYAVPRWREDSWL